jgi:hypothetical protein
VKLAVFQNRRWDSDLKTVTVLWMVYWEVVEADSTPTALSPKQHKETANDGAGILKDLGPT